jgi:hypothetical protein
MHAMPALIDLDWDKAHRLVPSHFPPISLFETVADPEDLELLYAVEALTNDRLRDEAGDLRLVATSDRISGPGSTPVMAAFTHIGVASRFTDGHYGVYYAARTLQTAIAETRYHRKAFLRATQEPDTELTLREYIGKVAQPLHDIRSPGHWELHQPDDYSPSQRFARQLREQESPGLYYSSVRDPGEECLAAFKPRALSIPVQGSHYRYVWSGHAQAITAVLKVEAVA